MGVMNMARYLQLICLANVSNLVQGFIKAVQGKVLLLPDPVHLQQPPQIAHLFRSACSAFPFSIKRALIMAQCCPAAWDDKRMLHQAAAQHPTEGTHTSS